MLSPELADADIKIQAIKHHDNVILKEVNTNEQTKLRNARSLCCAVCFLLCFLFHSLLLDRTMLSIFLFFLCGSSVFAFAWCCVISA